MNAGPPPAATPARIGRRARFAVGIAVNVAGLAIMLTEIAHAGSGVL